MENITIHNYEAFLLDHFESKLSPQRLIELKQFLLLHPELDVDLDDTEFPVLSKEGPSFTSKQHLIKKEIYLEDEELLNYLENHLSLESKKEFEYRVNSNRQLASDLRMYKATILKFDPNVFFPAKTILLKSEEEFILSSRVVAYFENALTVSEKLIFENELSGNAVLMKELATYSTFKLEADGDLIYPNKAALKKENKVVFLFSTRAAVALAAALLLVIGLVVVFQLFTSGQSEPVKLASWVGPSGSSIHKNVKKNSVKQQERKNTSSTVTPLLEKHPVQKTKVPTGLGALGPELSAQEKEKVVAVHEEIKEHVVDSSGTQVSVSNSELVQTMLTQNTLNFSIPYEEDTQDEDTESETKTKKGFWHLAASLANRVNQAGLKSVQGSELNKNHYLLSFNSFSVEKK